MGKKSRIPARAVGGGVGGGFAKPRKAGPVQTATVQPASLVHPAPRAQGGQRAGKMGKAAKRKSGKELLAALDALDFSLSGKDNSSVSTAAVVSIAAKEALAKDARRKKKISHAALVKKRRKAEAADRAENFQDKLATKAARKASAKARKNLLKR